MRNLNVALDMRSAFRNRANMIESEILERNRLMADAAEAAAFMK